MTHKGTMIQDLDDIVNGTLAAHGLHLERYPIDVIIDVLASVPPCRCTSCETAVGLFPCKDCHTFYCQKCKESHVCGGGPDAGQGRF